MWCHDSNLGLSTVSTEILGFFGSSVLKSLSLSDMSWYVSGLWVIHQACSLSNTRRTHLDFNRGACFRLIICSQLPATL